MSSNATPPPIVPVLAAIILNEQRHILIARRKLHLANGGKWEFPGGKLKTGESPEACLRREIAEELDCHVEVLHPFHLVNHQYPQYRILLIAYMCRFISGGWQLSDHSQVRWVTAQQLPEYDFSGADLAIVAKLRDSLG